MCWGVTVAGSGGGPGSAARRSTIAHLALILQLWCQIWSWFTPLWGTPQLQDQRAACRSHGGERRGAVRDLTKLYSCCPAEVAYEELPVKLIEEERARSGKPVLPRSSSPATVCDAVPGPNPGPGRQNAARTAARTALSLPQGPVRATPARRARRKSRISSFELTVGRHRPVREELSVRGRSQRKSVSVRFGR